MTNYDKIDAYVEAEKETIIKTADYIWSNAEISYEEFKSSAYYQELFESRGFTVSDRGIGGLETSWTATFGSGAPVLGIMLEFDALPGLGNDLAPKKTPCKNGNTNGHGCGHNLIGCTSTGAALALKAFLLSEGIPGTVQVYGCPAEEMLNGKNYMAMDGAFDKADVVLHNHPGPLSTVWNFHSTASVDLIVEFFGKTSHAGLAPWAGRSALHAQEVFVHAANCMREQMEPTARLHYQVLEAGKAVNVVPDYTKLLVRYRGPSAANILKHIEWIKKIAEGAAMCTETTTKVANLGGIHDCLPNITLAKHMHDLMTERYFPLKWSDEEQAFAKAIQKEMNAKETGMATTCAPLPMNAEVGGSSDVGTVTWKVPTVGVIHAAWPTGISPHTWGATACVGMSIGHKSAVAAAKTMAAVGMDVLTKPEVLKAAQDEFKAHLETSPFVSLCDSNKSPAGAVDMTHRHIYECCIHSAMRAFGLDDGHTHDH